MAASSASGRLKGVRVAAVGGVLLLVCGLATAWWRGHGARRLREEEKALPVRGAKAHCTFEESLSETNAAGDRVRFGWWRDEDEPVVHEAAVQVGEQWLELPEAYFGASFLRLLRSPDGQEWLALAQFDTEAAGDVEVLASDDGGRTFVHRATVPWPTYEVGLADATFEGRSVELMLEVEDEVSLAAAYWGPLDKLFERLGIGPGGPSLGPGRYVLHSSDGGRTFGDPTRVKRAQ
jgi:hypothetical protein